jgi:hypothetical protein
MASYFVCFKTALYTLGMIETELSPDQYNAIEDFVKQVDTYHDRIVVAQAAVEISRQFDIHSLVLMEQVFRKIGSDIYLIAAPLIGEMATPFSARLPHSGDIDYDYYLWVCMGKEDAQEKMAEVETDPVTNLRKLAQAGVLVLREGSRASRAMNAPSN